MVRPGLSPGVLPNGLHPFNGTQVLIEESRILGAPGHLGFQSLKLRQQDGGLELRHPVVAGHDVVLVPRLVGGPSAIGIRAASLGQLIIIGQDDPALAARDVLAHLEAEGAGVADRAHPLAFPPGAPTVTGILDDDKIMTAGDVQNLVHVARQPGEVNGYDGSRAGGDAALYLASVHVERLSLHVAEDGNGVHLQDCACRGYERVGRHDDFVPRPHARTCKGDFQRSRAVDRGDAEAGILEAGEAFFELPHLLPVPPLAAFEHFQDGVSLLLVVDGPRREGSRPNRLRSVYGKLRHC